MVGGEVEGDMMGGQRLIVCQNGQFGGYTRFVVILVNRTGAALCKTMLS